MRNRQMIVRWLMANSTAIEVRKREGKTFYVMVDPAAFREGVGRLLHEVQRIKSEGDYEAAKALFEKYGVHFEAELRDEVVARVERLQMPSYTGFVQPRLEPVVAGDGTITDVRISYPLDLTDPDARILREARRTASVAQGCSKRRYQWRVLVIQRTAVVLLLAVGFAAAGQAQLPGISGTPQGTAILRTEEARAPTPVDLQLLIESARSAQPHIQLAAIQALGRLERRDVITELLPHLRAGSRAARDEAVQAIGQAMRGEVLPLDPNNEQVDGVQQALIAAATMTNGPMGAVARTLGRLPYTTAEQVAKADAFLRQVLTLSSQVDRGAAAVARPDACRGAELLARLHSKLFKLPNETVTVLREIATAQTATVKRSDIGIRVAALQALVSAGGVDEETLKLEIADTFDPSFRRLSLVALSGAGSPGPGSRAARTISAPGCATPTRRSDTKRCEATPVTTSSRMDAVRSWRCCPTRTNTSPCWPSTRSATAPVMRTR